MALAILTSPLLVKPLILMPDPEETAGCHNSRSIMHRGVCRATRRPGRGMPDDNPTGSWSDADKQAQALAALIDAAGDDRERHGPVAPAELRRRLEALEAEWAEDRPDRQTEPAEVSRPRD